MSATVEDLRAYVGASVSDDDFLKTCLYTAYDLVNAYIVDTEYVPVDTLEAAYLQVGSEMFHRRSAPNGITQFAAFDGSSMRVARDPMTSVYPMLNRFIVGGV